MNKKENLLEVAKVFFKMGCFAFGGPAAHIAMMDDEIVRKRKWMTEQHFLDLVGATNLIPGPNSTEMTMHCGHERAGKLGLVVAGLSFILPAVFITGVFAWFYKEYGDLPEVEPFLMGIKPIVLVIILSAVIKLGKKALKSTLLYFIAILVIVLSLLGLNELFVLLVAGFLGLSIYGVRSRIDNAKSVVVPPLLAVFTGGLITKLTSFNLFLVFLKVGAILYGGGMVLFAFLDTELVDRGWLTEQQLMDAVAVGQLTPGPVLTTATFIGYQMTGFWGAIATTSGIFLPSFLFVLLLNPLIPRMQKSKPFRAFLDAVNIGALAIITVVLITMSRVTLIDKYSITITAIGLLLVFVYKKISIIWVIVIGALLGYLLPLVF